MADLENGSESQEVNEVYNSCPEFPFFGARYPDACCVDGKLYDLDDCDDNGNLYTPSEHNPCPFCRPTEFMEWNSMTQEEYDAYMNHLKELGYGKELR